MASTKTGETAQAQAQALAQAQVENARRGERAARRMAARAERAERADASAVLPVGAEKKKNELLEKELEVVRLELAAARRKLAAINEGCREASGAKRSKHKACEMTDEAAEREQRELEEAGQAMADSAEPSGAVPDGYHDGGYESEGPDALDECCESRAFWSGITDVGAAEFAKAVKKAGPEYAEVKVRREWCAGPTEGDVRNCLVTERVYDKRAAGALGVRGLVQPAEVEPAFLKHVTENFGLVRRVVRAEERRDHCFGGEPVWRCETKRVWLPEGSDALAALDALIAKSKRLACSAWSPDREALDSPAAGEQENEWQEEDEVQQEKDEICMKQVDGAEFEEAMLGLQPPRVVRVGRPSVSQEKIYMPIGWELSDELEEVLAMHVVSGPAVRKFDAAMEATDMVCFALKVRWCSKVDDPREPFDAYTTEERVWAWERSVVAAKLAALRALVEGDSSAKSPPSSPMH